jgi:Surface-adhesin protein E
MAQPARISYRLGKVCAPVFGLAFAAAAIALIGGCAHRVPLDEMMQMPIERLRPEDRLRQDAVLVGLLADIQKMPTEGTIETVYRVPKDHAGEVRPESCGLMCQTGGGLLGYFAPLVILPVAIVALPVIGVYELTKPQDSPRGVAAEPAVEQAALARDKERQASLRGSAQWLTTVALQGQFPATWDEAYITALRQGLDGNRPPVDRPVTQPQDPRTGKPRSATAQAYFGAGISRMVLVGSLTGEQTLIVCARSYLQSEVARARDFETCQSGPIDLADRQEGGQQLRAALVEKGRQLALLQAKAMRGLGPIEIVQADVVKGSRFAEIGEVTQFKSSAAGTLFVDLGSIEPAGKTDFWASLVVNLKEVSDAGVRSQWIDIQVACVPGTVRYFRKRSYTDRYGEGDLLMTAMEGMEIAPATLLDPAARLICDVGPKLRSR